MKKSPVKFSFVCDQKWEDMKVCSTGRFCSECDKVVRDYTKYSQREIEALKNERKDLCGQFAPHQIDSSLYPLNEVISKRPFALASIFVFLGFSSLKVSAQHDDSSSIEQVDSTRNEKSCSQQVSDSEKERIKRREKLAKRRKQIESAYLLESRGRNSTYLSWRFPFIIRRSNVRGRFRF